MNFINNKKILAGIGFMLLLVVVIVLSNSEFKAKQKIFPKAKVTALKKDFSLKDKLQFSVYLGPGNLLTSNLNIPNSVEKVMAQTNDIDGVYTDGNLSIEAGIVKITDKRIVEIPIEIAKSDVSNTLDITAYPDEITLNPGGYTLEVIIHKGDLTQTITQDFSWGVLAINTNKSLFLPNETAKLSFGVLNDGGETVCSAGLNLTITDPSGVKTNLSTYNTTIATNPLCKDKSYSIKPDYEAQYVTNKAGKYTMELQAETANGKYSVTDFFEVREYLDFEVERISATRINPQYNYPVILRIKANKDFSGDITESLPLSFTATTNKISELNRILEEYDGSTLDVVNQNFASSVSPTTTSLTWTVNFKKDATYLLSYTYTAPQISPEFYLAGPLTIFSSENFTEVRQWQIASDAPANMILLWDNGSTTAPADWLCISCEPADPFYMKYVRGNSTYGTTGGQATHSHTMNTGNSTAGNYSAGATGTPPSYYPPLSGHTHGPGTVVGNTAPNLPTLRYLNVIKYKYGIPASLPAGVIAIFDSSTAPPGWTELNGATNYEDGRYVRGGSSNIAGTTAGSNTHTHNITITSSAAPASGTRARSGSVYVGAVNHTHTCGPSASDSQSIEPPYTTVLLAKKDSIGAAPANIISMFDATPPSAQWTAKSASSSDPFYQRFAKPTGTYGTTSPTYTHTHASASVSCGNASASTGIGASGSTYADSGTNQHTHTYSSVSFGTALDHTPEYADVIYAQALSAINTDLKLAHYHWRNDDNNEANATAAIVSEDATYASYPYMQRRRLRIGVSNDGSGTAVDTQFRLDYGIKVTSCSAIGTWTPVDTGNHWSMSDTTNLTDGDSTTDIDNSIGGVTNSASHTFMTPNYSVKDTSNTTAANNLSYEDWLEMEYSIIPASTAAGLSYCFRIVDTGSKAVSVTFTTYPEATVLTPSYISIEGVVYMADETTLATFSNGGPCTGTGSYVAARTDGGTEYTTSCSGTDATFTISSVIADAGQTIAMYLTGVSAKANRIYISDGSNDLDKFLYVNRIALDYEQGTSIAISDMLDYDSTQNDTDMLFNATDATPDTFITEANTELHITAEKTFNPTGTITTGTNGGVHLDDSAIMYFSDATNTILGNLSVDTGATAYLDTTTSISGTITTSGTGLITRSTGTPTVTLRGSGTLGGGTNPMAFYSLIIGDTNPSYILGSPISTWGLTIGDANSTSLRTLDANTNGKAVTVTGDFTIAANGRFDGSSDITGITTLYEDFVCNTSGQYSFNSGTLLITGTTSSTVDSGVTDVGEVCTNKNFNKVIINKTATDTSNNNATFDDAGNRRACFNNTLTVTDGDFITEESLILHGITPALYIGYSGTFTFRNTSTYKSMTVYGGVTNFGTVTIGYESCLNMSPDYISIISSPIPTVMPWNGPSNNYFINNVDINYQGGDIPIKAYNSSGWASMGSNWTNVASCPAEPNTTDFNGLDLDGINVN